MTRALLISLPLVFLLGMAIQRGNTCTVVAIDDIVHRRSWDRFLAIASAWFLVAGGLVLLGMATGSSLSTHAFPVTAWSAAGGMLLGLERWSTVPAPPGPLRASARVNTSSCSRLPASTSAA
ncbi:MAG: hypothetical protein ACOYB7_15335 [Mycobacterium sp.]